MPSDPGDQALRPGDAGADGGPRSRRRPRVDQPGTTQHQPSMVGEPADRRSVGAAQCDVSAPSRSPPKPERRPGEWPAQPSGAGAQRPHLGFRITARTPDERRSTGPGRAGTRQPRTPNGTKAMATAVPATSAVQRVHEQHGTDLGVAHLEQPVVQVLLVGRERVATGPGAPDDGQQQVDQRAPPCTATGSRIGSSAGISVAPAIALGSTWPEQRDRASRQEQAEDHRPGVAHEDAGREEVVRQEAHAHPGQQRRDQAWRAWPARSRTRRTAGRSRRRRRPRRWPRSRRPARRGRRRS